MPDCRDRKYAPRAPGVESDKELAFASLRQLCAPFAARLGACPRRGVRRQRSASGQGAPTSTSGRGASARPYRIGTAKAHRRSPPARARAHVMSLTPRRIREPVDDPLRTTPPVTKTTSPTVIPQNQGNPVGPGIQRTRSTTQSATLAGLVMSRRPAHASSSPDYPFSI